MSHFLRSLPSALLILLLVYAAAAKLENFAAFRVELNRQTVPHEVATLLAYLIPAAELAAVILLLFDKTSRAGLFLSLSLLCIFSFYIALVLLHFWSRVPCPCGGILSRMPWSAHLLFNLFFIAINLVAIHIHTKERRAVTIT